MVKVSVVIPAYCPGKGIDRVIGSLDAQTMPSDEFEAIIVDDGSPDDTWAQLERIRDSHRNVRIERIENSGWPSRPRNIGIDLAQGEYVLFMDHDDQLFPDGLQASYDFAVRHHADVLSAKESKTSDISWGVTNYTADIGNARPTRGIGSLLPMMPHKFYRTAFLREHNIRFPEGRRMLWEDVYFNVAAYRYAEVISILSSVPVYLWVQGETNNSATYGPAEEEFWVKLRALLDYIHATLPGEEFADARNSTLAHQYRTRVLGRFWGALGASPDRGWVEMALGHLREILDTLIPAELDDRLPASVKPLAYLLRAQRYDLLDPLREAQGSWVGLSRADRLAWDDDGLIIEATARWSDRSGRRLPLLQRDGRLLRRYPDELMAVLPHELVDVTDAVWKATSQLTVRDKQRNTTWKAPTHSTVELEPLAEPGTVTVVVRSTTTVAVDADRAPGTWLLHARNSVLGYTNHRAVHAEALPEAVVLDGRAVTPRRDKLGKVSLVVAAGLDRAVELLHPLDGRADFTAGAAGVEFSVALTGCPTRGAVRVACTLTLTPAQPLLARVGLSTKLSRLGPTRAGQRLLVRSLDAVLVIDERGARLEGTVRALPGRYGLAWTVEGRTARWPGYTLRVPATGLPHLERAS